MPLTGTELLISSTLCHVCCASTPERRRPQIRPLQKSAKMNRPCRPAMAPSIDNPANYGASERVVVFGNRSGHALSTAGYGRKPEAPVGFHDEPTVVLSTAAGCRLKVDFLVLGLTHIENIKITGQLIKRKPPRIAQPQSPDFVAIAVNVSERVVRWDALRLVARLHIDPQDLAQQYTGILRYLGVARRMSAVPAANVQVAILRSNNQGTSQMAP